MDVHHSRLIDDQLLVEREVYSPREVAEAACPNSQHYLWSQHGQLRVAAMPRMEIVAA